MNERKYAEDAINNGVTDRFPSITLRVLIKYYLSKNMNTDQVLESIRDFMKKNCKGYNSAFWENKYDTLISQVKSDGYEMLEIDEIPVTKKELEIIKSLDNNRLEKLAFVLLVHSKIYNIKNRNNTYWVNSKTSEIFTDCKIATNQKRQELLIHELINLGLIENSKRIDCNNILVKIANEDSETVITITDFRDFVYYYLRWRGENIGECKCGNLYKITSNNHQMCKHCWKQENKEQVKERVRKFRNKNM